MRAAVSDRWTARLGAAGDEKPRRSYPLDEELFDSHCPYCDQALDRPCISISSLLLGGFRQLGFAVLMIAFAVVRCLRFALAALLCLVGFVGDCCRALGNQIAHENDRPFLKKL